MPVPIIVPELSAITAKLLPTSVSSETNNNSRQRLVIVFVIVLYGTLLTYFFLPDFRS